ncbi:hypothetical protein [Parasulfitobacter algicola]|uniref:Uncharacterized protein n=1 Tax=Parasulfitobacter algicola TaxID=2614809 RepID=A0ABX2J0D9_9RHOB|nr:hypothetical protein [Sulfitobacter algicola]NSX56586.1 hypothetical protein [Sulfitobacter algicola]
MIKSIDSEFAPKSIVEIGPGDTIGIGIATLITGAETYTGLDAQQYAKPEEASKNVDALVKLFEERTPIPNKPPFEKVKPYLENYDFPDFLNTDLICLTSALVGQI